MCVCVCVLQIAELTHREHNVDVVAVFLSVRILWEGLAIHSLSVCVFFFSKWRSAHAL